MNTNFAVYNRKIDWEIGSTKNAKFSGEIQTTK